MHHKKPEFVKVYKEYSTKFTKFFSYIRKEKVTDAEPRPEYKKEPRPRPETRP